MRLGQTVVRYIVRTGTCEIKQDFCEMRTNSSEIRTDCCEIRIGSGKLNPDICETRTNSCEIAITWKPKYYKKCAVS